MQNVGWDINRASRSPVSGTSHIALACEPDLDQVLAYWCQLAQTDHPFQPFGQPLVSGLGARLKAVLDGCFRRDDAAIFVAHNGQLCGSVAVILNTHDGFSRPSSGVIFNLWVEAVERRKGLGSLLVASAESWLRSEGATSAQAGWHPNNHAADRFWRQRGYQNYELIGAIDLVGR